MHRSTKSAETTSIITWQMKLQKRAAQGIFVMMSALCFLFVSNNAYAACGNFGGANIGGGIKLPLVKNAVPNLYVPFRHDLFPIVGLWHVIYTAGDGSTFNDTFDTWHNDGTEFESAFLPPAGGNVCAGVWKPTGFRSVTLHHVGWLFDPSKPTATATNSFTLDELVTVSEDGTAYSGSFTFKIWNLDGTPTSIEVTGTIAANRIVAD